MKHIIQIFLTITLLLSLIGCDDTLDNSIDIDLTPDQVYVNFERMEQAAAGTYINLSKVSGFYVWGNSLKACASDEAEETSYSSKSQQFNIGSWNQYSNPDDIYESMYIAIRQCNLFLENSTDYKTILVRDTITSSGKDKYIQQCELIGWYRYEVQFLRAFYHFELAKRYGGIPIIRKTITEDEALKIPRSGFQECMTFVREECDSIYKYMQYDWVTAKYPDYHGRATAGAALALASRAALYQASPLHNPNNDIELWKEAAKAAKALIDLTKANSSTPQYSLASNYEDMFLAPNSYSGSEVIFYLRLANSNVLEAWNYPIGTPGGSSGVSPSQNLVDAYEKLSGWDPANPYDKVDPRLQKTIVVNNSTWNGRTIESYIGGIDGPDKRNASRTGYYLKKFLSPNLVLTGANPGRSMKAWIFFRYSEAFLNYAEAMNEAFGPDYTDATYTLSAREALNKIRQRSDINLPAIQTGLGKDEFKKIVKNERRVELAFEEHRVWDLRRWKEGDTLGDAIKGVRVTKNADNTFSYNLDYKVEDRVFSEKMYYYPIPQSEINKNPEVIKQNPLW